MSSSIDRLLSIMVHLRDPVSGCEWDKAQTHATIVPHTIEEAYEVADAVERGDPADLRDELGDLLFQVVFQARIAEESGSFDFDDVADSMADKLTARHPHIFTDNAEPEMQEERWEAIKAAERHAKGTAGALEGVARALPALLRAEKLQKRAARTGFDWPDTKGPEAKVLEELRELSEAPADKREEEAGDLLFAVVNLLRAYGISAEAALRAGNDKFERRFKAMEEKAAEGDFVSLNLDEKEVLWHEVKSEESSTNS